MRKLYLFFVMVLMAGVMNTPALGADVNHLVTVRATDGVLIQVDAAMLPGKLITTTHTTKLSVDASVKLSGMKAATFARGTGCWVFERDAVQNSQVLSIELWRYKMVKSWCGTFDVPYILQITRAPVATVQPKIKGVAGLAWEYKGIINTNTNVSGFYYSCCGISGRSGSAAFVTGDFQDCIDIPVIGHHCVSEVYPHVWINAHYNGDEVSGVNNGGTQQ